MKLKESPEDFLVDEIPIEFSGEGEYLIVRVTKRLCNTEDAAQILAKSFGIHRKFVGYAGAKDKVAVTTQFFSLKNVAKEKVEEFHHDQIELEVVGKHSRPLSLGDLLGNRFTIIVRELQKPLVKKDKVRNYFGPQRFGDNNVEVGKLLLQKKFAQACELLELETANPVASLRVLPKHTLMIYLHAYQSWLWNEVLRSFSDTEVPEVLPIVGFGTELDEYGAMVEEKYEALLDSEGITQRNFIIKQLPNLSPEGTERDCFMDVQNLELGEFEGGVQKVSFVLGKGSYATVVIEALS